MLLLVSASVVSAWEEPTDFRGIPWGAKPDEVKQKLPALSCKKECHGYLMIGEIRAFTMILFDSGGMDAVSLSFPTERFSTMKDIFMARYGQPNHRNNEIIHNRLGAMFTNETLSWDGARVKIRLEQYGSRLTHSSAIFMTREHMRASDEQSRQKVKAGKKDL